MPRGAAICGFKLAYSSHCQALTKFSMRNFLFIIFNVVLFVLLLSWNLTEGSQALDNARAHNFYGGYCGSSSLGESDPTCFKKLAFNFYLLHLSIPILSFLNVLIAKGVGNLSFRKSLITSFIVYILWISTIEGFLRIMQIPVLYFTPTEGRISLLFSAYLLFFPFILLLDLVFYVFSTVGGFAVASCIRYLVGYIKIHTSHY